MPQRFDAFEAYKLCALVRSVPSVPRRPIASHPRPQYPRALVLRPLSVLMPSAQKSHIAPAHSIPSRVSVPRCFCSIDAPELRRLKASAFGGPTLNFHPCTSCRRNLPLQDKHTLCVKCLGIDYASAALADKTLCSIFAGSKEKLLQNRMAQFTGRLAASLGEPSSA
ncbi:UNVERIFIED_CONTAM: hypothetical protein FKN15_068315 [Acipenser sinensis]